MKVVASVTTVLLLGLAVGLIWKSSTHEAPPQKDTGGDSSASNKMAPQGLRPAVVEAVRSPVDIEPPENFPTIIKKSVLEDLRRRMGDELETSQVSDLVDTVSEDSLMAAREDSLLRTALFKTLVPDEVRESAAYRNRFRLALSDLRKQRKALVVERDSLTGSYLDLVLQGEAPRGRSERGEGALGGYVGSTVSPVTGWIEVPRDHEAYTVQQEIDAWRMSSIEILSRLHL